jgi:hypothetical protein
MRQCGKISQSRTGHRRQYGACALHAGYTKGYKQTCVTSPPLRQWLQERDSLLHTVFIYTIFLVALLPRLRAVIHPIFTQCFPASGQSPF